MRVALSLVVLAFGGLAACTESDKPPAAGSDESPANDAFGDATEQDRAGFAEIGRGWWAL
jgi:hypothetical protein